MFRIYFPIQKVIMIDLQAVSIIGVQIGYNGIGFLVNFEKWLVCYRYGTAMQL